MFIKRINQRLRLLAQENVKKELWVERFRGWLKRIERDARKIISDAEMWKGFYIDHKTKFVHPSLGIYERGLQLSLNLVGFWQKSLIGFMIIL